MSDHGRGQMQYFDKDTNTWKSRPSDDERVPGAKAQATKSKTPPSMFQLPPLRPSPHPSTTRPLTGDLRRLGSRGRSPQIQPSDLIGPWQPSKPKGQQVDDARGVESQSQAEAPTGRKGYPSKRLGSRRSEAAAKTETGSRRDDNPSQETQQEPWQSPPIAPQELRKEQDAPHDDQPSEQSLPRGSNKYKCPYCAIEFTRHDKLKNHLLTHSHEKPYQEPSHKTKESLPVRIRKAGVNPQSRREDVSETTSPGDGSLTTAAIEHSLPNLPDLNSESIQPYYSEEHCNLFELYSLCLAYLDFVYIDGALDIDYRESWWLKIGLLQLRLSRWGRAVEIERFRKVHGLPESSQLQLHIHDFIRLALHQIVGVLCVATKAATIRHPETKTYVPIRWYERAATLHSENPIYILHWWARNIRYQHGHRPRSKPAPVWHVRDSYSMESTIDYITQVLQRLEIPITDRLTLLCTSDLNELDDASRPHSRKKGPISGWDSNERTSIDSIFRRLHAVQKTSNGLSKFTIDPLLQATLEEDLTRRGLSYRRWPEVQAIRQDLAIAGMTAFPAQTTNRSRERNGTSEFQNDVEPDALPGLLLSDKVDQQNFSQRLLDALHTVPRHGFSFTWPRDKSLLNRAKQTIESATGYSWDWWPLAPPERPLQTGYRRVKWNCMGWSGSIDLIEKDILALDELLRQLPPHPPECRCCSVQRIQIPWRDVCARSYRRLMRILEVRSRSQKYLEELIILSFLTIMAVSLNGYVYVYSNHSSPSTSEAHTSSDPLRISGLFFGLMASLQGLNYWLMRSSPVYRHRESSLEQHSEPSYKSSSQTEEPSDQVRKHNVKKNQDGSSSSARVPTATPPDYSASSEPQGVALANIGSVGPQFGPEATTGTMALNGTTASTPPKLVLFGVSGATQRTSLAQLDIKETSTDKSFFHELLWKYRKHRSWFALCFSPFKFASCNSVEFRLMNVGWLISIVGRLPHARGYGDDYEYNPKLSEAELPLVTKDEYKFYLSICTDTCIRRLWMPWHTCLTMPGGIEQGDKRLQTAPHEVAIPALTRLPKKLTKYLFWSTYNINKSAFGIETEYDLSLVAVTVYHMLLILPSFGFWVYWLYFHPGDLQNASVPLFTAFGVIASTWTAVSYMKK